MRVIVTRPALQAAEWVARLTGAGFDAIALPLIGVEPLADRSGPEAAWRDLGRYTLVVFVSPNAVLRFFDARPAAIVWPARTLAGSPGPGTSRTLRQAGLADAAIAEPTEDAVSFDAEALWSTLRARDWRGAEVLIVRGETGRDALARTLADAGARVTTLAAYRRGAATLGPDDALRLREAVADPSGHLWWFSSSAAIDQLVEWSVFERVEGSMFQPVEASMSHGVEGSTLQATQSAAFGQGVEPTHPGADARDWRSASALVTHPQIAASARARGFGRVIEARPSPEAVIACLESLRP